MMDEYRWQLTWSGRVLHAQLVLRNDCLSQFALCGAKSFYRPSGEEKVFPHCKRCEREMKRRKGEEAV